MGDVQLIGKLVLCVVGEVCKRKHVNGVKQVKMTLRKLRVTFLTGQH